MEMRAQRVDREYVAPFRIAGRTKTHALTVVVELRDGGLVGRGEAVGVPYHGETADTVLGQLAAIESGVRNGLSREHLQTLLPAGGARNALDCALWDLEAKRSGRRAWELAGLPGADWIETDYTLGLDTPEVMGRAATELRGYSVLKVKLDGEGDLERMMAVRKARPDAVLIVDANQAWNERELRELTPRLAELGVKLIEQPLPREQDDVLAGFQSPVPLCADESCQTSASLEGLVGKYQYVNIKLDKAGGLTEALRLARRGQELGFKLMVGCMGGSSLSMAPAYLLGPQCDFIDLDGPLRLKADVADAIRYEGGRMFAPEARLWG
jgi:L-Ala-D/L-Glu epimerase